MITEKNKLAATALAGLLIAGLAPLAPPVSAQTKPAVELEGAIAKEQVNGDLKAAIAAYQKIAANSAAPRDVRAKALWHLAGCYEKQGQQAQTVYQQIVRDYADQPAAKQASAKLAGMRQRDRDTTPTTMTQRKIEAPASLPGFAPDFSDNDGRHAVYRDHVTGNLMFGDLTSGESRVILKPNASALRTFWPSRDMSMAYMLLASPDGKQTTAVIRTDGTAYREIPGVAFSGRLDWSWDNRYVLVCENQPDGTRRPVRISVADGSKLDLRWPERCIQMFSPDGRFIASVVSSHDAGPIFVGPSDGGSQQPVFDDARLIGWTRDGRYLAVDIYRSGAEGLYLLPMKDGQRAGEPVLVRYGSFGIAQTFANGALVYEPTPAGGNYSTWLGTLDSDGRLAGWKQLDLSGSKRGPYAPTWSPDSKQIAYVTSGNAAGQNIQVVRVRDVATGAERDIYQGGSGEMSCVWATLHPKLFCGQITTQSVTDVVAVAIDSGRTERLGSVQGLNLFLFGEPSDQGIYMASRPQAELIRWEIATGQTTALGQGRVNMANWVIASPDGRWITRLQDGKTEIRPVSRGDWKPLAPGGTQNAFSPDGNWLLYHGVDAAGKQSLFRISVVGGQPERLGDFPAATRIGIFSISPDGRKIVADTLRPIEVWALENFEPKQ